MLETLFFVSLFLVFFAYFGYPLTLLAGSTVRRRDQRPVQPPSTAELPQVTLIVTAYNEEQRIRAKLENSLALDYPADRLEILVASDGSTDATDGIVAEYAERGVRLVPLAIRGGKEAAQKEAVAQSQGEILVFSDVATRLEPDGLRQIVSNFADPAIGCVSSVDRVLGPDGKPTGEGLYVRYEMWLRNLESRFHSLVGLSGSFFAARREVCQDFSAEMQSDFRTLLNSMRLGLRGVSDPRAVGYYQDLSDGRREFDRKVRTVLRGLTVFFRNLEFLNGARYGIFSYQYFCHKLLRWLVPFLLLAALLANLLLVPGSSVYLVLFAAQCGFYLAGAWRYGRGAWKESLPFKLPRYFLTVNLAIAVAWWRYLRGNRLVMWTPSER